MKAPKTDMEIRDLIEEALLYYVEMQNTHLDDDEVKIDLVANHLNGNPVIADPSGLYLMVNGAGFRVEIRRTR